MYLLRKDCDVFLEDKEDPYCHVTCDYSSEAPAFPINSLMHGIMPCLNGDTEGSTAHDIENAMNGAPGMFLNFNLQVYRSRILIGITEQGEVGFDFPI